MWNALFFSHVRLDWIGLDCCVGLLVSCTLAEPPGMTTYIILDSCIVCLGQTNAVLAFCGGSLEVFCFNFLPEPGRRQSCWNPFQCVANQTNLGSLLYNSQTVTLSLSLSLCLVLSFGVCMCVFSLEQNQQVRLAEGYGAKEEWKLFLLRRRYRWR